jgi:hypothetical protein
MHNLSKLELPLCAEAVDILEAVLYGTSQNQIVTQAPMSPSISPQEPFVQSASRFQAAPKKKGVFAIIAFVVLLSIVIFGLIHREKVLSVLSPWKGYGDFDSFSRAADVDEFLGEKLTKEGFVAIALLGAMYTDKISLDIVSGDKLTQRYNVSSALQTNYDYLVKRSGINGSTTYCAYFNGDNWVVIYWKEE